MKRVIKAASSNDIYYWNGEDKVPEDVVNLVIEEGVRSIGRHGCSYRSDLKSVTIPSTLISIGEAAFCCCPNLEQVIIPEASQLENIWNSAFSDDTSLQSIDIPASVERVWPNAFANCSSLTEVNIASPKTKLVTNPFWGTPLEARFEEPKATYEHGKDEFLKLSDKDLLQDFYEYYIPIRDSEDEWGDRKDAVYVCMLEPRSEYEEILGWGEEGEFYNPPLYINVNTGERLVGAVSRGRVHHLADFDEFSDEVNHLAKSYSSYGNYEDYTDWT